MDEGQQPIKEACGVNRLANLVDEVGTAQRRGERALAPPRLQAR